MKFILAFSVCSAITGFCDNTMTLEKPFDTWSECVGHGGGNYYRLFYRDARTC